MASYQDNIRKFLAALQDEGQRNAFETVSNNDDAMRLARAVLVKGESFHPGDIGGKVYDGGNLHIEIKKSQKLPLGLATQSVADFSTMEPAALVQALDLLVRSHL